MGVGQEFYCAESGGGCGGFITFPLNMKINGVVEVICPKCGHEHQRGIKNGVLTGQDRHSSSPVQQICPTLAAWSKEAKHPESKNRVGDWSKEREAVVTDKSDKKSQKKGFRPFLSDLWFERFGGRK